MPWPLQRIFKITQQDNRVFIHIARPLYEFVQNFRFAHFLFAIQAKLAYVNKLSLFDVLGMAQIRRMRRRLKPFGGLHLIRVGNALCGAGAAYSDSGSLGGSLHHLG